jgi:3-methyladenine DNA glycosylase/8-oxoguanine DNA glycosylase
MRRSPPLSIVKIATPPNFSFPSTVVSHGWYRLAPFRWSRANATLRRAEVVDGRAVDLTITHHDDVLHVEGARDTRELRAKLTRMFQLHLDLSGFLTMTRTSAAHTWIERAGFGRLLCGSTLFEDVAKIILTTNTMWRQTVRMNELLVEKCGRRTKKNNAAFPLAEDVAQFDADELQRECRLGYRAKSISALARGIADGSLDLARIADPSQTTGELFASYRELPGIGPYGAAHLLAMDGRHDFIAVDTEFRRFVRETYHGGRAIKESTMLRRYNKWGRWKYLAYWSELWNSIADRLDEDK